MLFEFYAMLGALDVILFFMGFFGVPKQDKNTQMTLMMITTVISFMMVMASFQVDVTTCVAATNTTCTSAYSSVQNSINETAYLNSTNVQVCSAAGLDCLTKTYQEMELVGLFLLMAVLSLIYAIMSYLGYLPTENSSGGFEGSDRSAPKKFGGA